MKNTMTKAEAREFLKDKYVPVKGLEEWNKAAEVFGAVFPKLGEWPIYEEQISPATACIRLWPTGRAYGIFTGSIDKQKLPLSELLSIEITDEPFFVSYGGCDPESKWNEKTPNYEQKFREAVDCIERMIESANAGKTLPKIDSHTASIGRQFIKANKG